MQGQLASRGGLTRLRFKALVSWQVLRQSRLYESAPAYVTDQPRFLNAALAVETALQPEELLTVLKRIEVWSQQVMPSRELLTWHALSTNQQYDVRQNHLHAWHRAPRTC